MASNTVAHTTKSTIWLILDQVRMGRTAPEIAESLRGIITYEELVAALVEETCGEGGSRDTDTIMASVPHRLPWTIPQTLFVLGIIGLLASLLWISPYPINLIIAAMLMGAAICLVAGFRDHFRKR